MTVSSTKNKTITYNLKKNIFILIFYLPLIAIGQSKNIFGTYKTWTLGNSPIIKLFPDSTFSYTSPIDVGYVPETFGNLKFSGDTIYFNYEQKIHPEIIDSSSLFNPNHKNILIKVNGNLTLHNNIFLYVNDPFSDSSQIVTFDSNFVASLDSINKTDKLYIHVGMYSRIPISINFQEKNEFFFKILLPPEKTIYFMTEKKALLKNGFIYFSMTENGIPYYKIDLFNKNRKIKKIKKEILKKNK